VGVLHGSQGHQTQHGQQCVWLDGHLGPNSFQYLVHVAIPAYHGSDDGSPHGSPNHRRKHQIASPAYPVPTLAISWRAHISQDIKTNQQDCVRLAQRAARLLMDLGRRMEGKWEDAPQSLLENIRELEAWVSRTRALSSLPTPHVLLFFRGFLRTLLSMRDFMLKAAQTKWISRLVAKTRIQEALMQFDQQLRDAATSFQVRHTDFWGAMELNVSKIRSPHW
jgi:hypothetical protein